MVGKIKPSHIYVTYTFYTRKLIFSPGMINIIGLERYCGAYDNSKQYQCTCMIGRGKNRQNQGLEFFGEIIPQDYLLSSRNDPLSIGEGKPGMHDPIDRAVKTGSSVLSPSKLKLKRGIDSVDSVMGKKMKSVVDLCEVFTEKDTVVAKAVLKSNKCSLDDLSMDGL